jgi:hypothetical protein
MKLRKFITGLAVGALMVVTMATGVFAATSPSKESTSTVAGVSGLNIKNDGVDCSLPTIITPVTVATQAQAEAAANKIGYTVIKFFDLEETELSVYKNNTTVKMMVDNVLAGMKVKVLHLPDGKDGAVIANWEVIDPDEVGAGYVTATFTNLSPVAIVVPTSSKTGETLPLLTIAGIICLAGVVICGAKMKFAK